MAAIKYSDEQKLAIDTKGLNIIVSAGAGSGKTAVLTERIKRTLLSGVRADQLLVLTFTNAAAAEMKERVTKKMAEDESLKQRTAEVDSAYITTFDSFSLSIVKKYHDKLNLNRNISIIETSVLNVKKRQILDKIFDAYYLSNDTKFIKLITNLTPKDDKAIRKEILSLANKLDQKHDRNEFLDGFVDSFYNDLKCNDYINEYKNILFEIINQIKENTNKILEYLQEEQQKTYLANYMPLLCAKTYDDIVNWLCSPKTTIRKMQEEAKAIHKANKELEEDLDKLCIYPNEAFIKEAFLDSKTYVEVIKDILKEYYKRIDDFKSKNNSFEFVDIAKMAISLVKDNEEIANELKEMFVEILVDEYQDTNDLQEIFISYISKDNVYMVGDIKQSIYGFRNANPMIFKEKYDSYKDDTNKKGMKIDLNQNFRSNRQVLFTINRIFDDIMDDNIGHANFKKEHQMRFGLTDYDKQSQTDKISFVTYTIDKEDKTKYETKEIDMFYVLKDIQRKLDNKELVYDKDLKIFRPCEYKDFAILAPDSTMFDSLGMLLTHHHIPNLIFKNVDVNNGDILIILKNIIKLIALTYKKEYKEDFFRCFYGIGRSFVFNYNDEYLFNVVTQKTYENSELFKVISRFSEIVDFTSLHDLLEQVLDELNVYEKLITIGDVEENLTRIEYILKLMSSMDALDLDIFEFVEYFDDILNHEEKMEFQSGDLSENKVKIMTIHKSKGLEFPIVYFIGNEKRFNKRELNEKLIFDNKYGIVVPFYKDGIGRNINYQLAKLRYNDALISERIRLLYVALTRAREQMVVIYKNEENECEYEDLVPLTIRKKYNSFSSIFNSIKRKLVDKETIIDLPSFKTNKNYLLSTKKDINSLISPSDIKIEYIENNIESIEINKSHASKESKQLASAIQKESMEYGTHIHEVFESIDYVNPNFEELSTKEIQMVNNFINQPLMKNIHNGKVYKEFEFIYKENGKQMHGIIDLMIEYDNYIDIIDYKLSKTEDEAYINQLTNYKNYISNKTNKKVNIYLYSIMKNKMEEL